MSVRITDNTNRFLRKNEDALEQVFEAASTNILRLAKMTVPHLTGALQSSGDYKKQGRLKWWIYFNKIYARRREFEENVRFSEPGKKAHYLRDAGDTIAKQILPTIKYYLGQIR